MDKKNIEDVMALTPMQEGLLYHYLKEPESEYYFEQLSLSISGEIDIPTFKRAWDYAAANNEMLRTVFRWEEVKKPNQIVLKHHQPRVEIFDFPGKSGDRGQWEPWVEEIRVEDRKRKFHLREVPFRVTLCKMGAVRGEVILSYHHILYDGWSSGIILKEFFGAYNRLSEGNDGKRGGPGKTKFKEYVRWIQNRDLKKQEVFWKDYLQGIDTRTGLPASKAKAGGVHDNEIIKTADFLSVINSDIRERLEDFVKTHKITLAALFYTTWGTLLQRYNNSKDVIFGTTISGRSAKIKEIENIVGLFINTLPLRVRTYPGDNVSRLLIRVHDGLQSREEYEATSLADIKTYSQMDNQDEIFDSIMVLDNYPLDNFLLQKSKPITVDSYSMFEMSNYDLTVGFALLLKDIKVKFSYNTALFDEAIISRLFGHFMNLLLDITASPGKPAAQLQLLTEEEKKQLVIDFNDTGEPYPVDKTIHERFEQQVENTPDTIALVFENERFLTYKHMNRQANRLAHRLRTLGVKTETPVGIMGGYSLEMAVGLMAILKAGGVYVTIGPDYPGKRVEYILKDSRANILLTRIDFKNRFPGVAFAGNTIEIAGWTQTTGRGTENNPGNITNPDHLAFILYTSGSTGRPKGVMVEHRNVNNLLNWFGKTYGLRVGMRVLQLTDYTFDPHVDDIFGTLFFGSTLYVVGKDLLMDMEALRRYVERHQVNLINCVPSLIKELLCRGHRLSSMDTVISGGDRLDDALKDELIDRGYLLFNHYGLIETTVDILVSRCAKTVGASVVRPLANTGAYIVDQDKNLLPGGVVGELSLSGDSLGRGYSNRPGLTADRFLESPFKPGERMFLTGDLARLYPGGDIEIMDRMDHQVKIRGFRIEPGEIENQLIKHKDVKEAAVIARENSSGGKYLCGYVVPEHNRLTVDGRWYHIYTTAQQPGFKDKIEQVHADAWPAFFIGDEINVTYWKQLYEVFPDFQVGIVDEAGGMIAAGNSIPIAWNGKIPDLPQGWDDAVVKGFETARSGQGTISNTLCVLAGVVNQAFKSKGMSYEVIKILKGIARAKGFEYIILPVRVTEKERFPYLTLEEYCEKKRGDGLPVDPWLRVHLRLGGKIIGYSHASQQVKGTVKEWETWTGQSFEKSGAYVIPGAMQPVDIDIENDRGTYNDLAVWVQHAPARETDPPINLLNSTDTRDYLSHVLPDYMVPVKVVFLDKIPLTPIGKIDRKALPAPEMKVVKGYTAPKHELEQELLEIWADVLGLDKEKISTTDNFFELGGHSLRATEVVYRVRKALKVKLELKEFMKEPVILPMAEKIKHLRPLKYHEIGPVEEKEYYPLSYAQRRLWIICQFEEDSASYNMVGTFTITGSFSPGAFEKAIRTLVERQGSFRTVFINVTGAPKQKILRDFKYTLEQVDLRVVTGPGEKEQKISDIIKQDANRVFDLEKGPLFLFKILQLEDEEYILIVNIHHIINDGWSLGIINNEIITLYNAYLHNRDNPLPPLELQYRDYTLWHNGSIDGGHLQNYGRYWLEKFKDKPGGIELPLDHPRPPIQTFNGGRVYFTVEEQDTERLEGIYPEEEATMFMKLLTLLTVFLYRYTGQTDIMIGAPISGRGKPELYHMIGFLVNTLVYRNRVVPNQSFPQLLRKVKQETLACYENQDYPFDALVERLELDRDLSRSPLFNVMMAFDNTDIDDLDLKMEGITFTRDTRVDDYNPSIFDLVFITDQPGDRVNVEIMYNSDLFDRSTIERMADNFKTMVSDVLECKDVPINRLNYIHEQEYRSIVRTFNRTQEIFPPITLQEMFESQVEKTPGKIALVGVNNERTVTYEDLNRSVNQLAHYLREEYRVKPGEIIGISMDRSLEMIVALLGIVKAGAGYVAIDTNYPEERALHMLTDSRCQRIIIDRRRPELFGNYSGQLIHIHRQWEQVSGKNPGNPVIVNEPGDIIYVIYTSGSTGTPNGAMLSQALLSNLVQWQHNCTSIDSSGRCLQFTTISFCVSFQEIFTTLTAGGELHLIDDIERRDIDYLMNFLSQRQIELLYLPFSYLNHLFNESSRWGGDFKHSLKHIITAGEQLKITSGLKEFLDRHPRLQLHNHYGSSEMHVVTSYTLDGAAAARYPVPPAGKPIANTGIFILDEHRQPVPMGVWGELCIAGSAEIAGYINNKSLTEEKLLSHPTLSRPGNRLYISGDIGRWLPDGNIELRGRKDTQIKIRGFRVELSEIESKLLAIDRVKECVVEVKEKAGASPEQKYLVAYVVLDNIGIKEIKQMIAHYLPHYMIPRFMVLEALPLMPNGKVDRENLPEPEDQPGYGAIAAIEAHKISSLLKGEKITEAHLADSTPFPGKAGLEKMIAYSVGLLQGGSMMRPFTVTAVDTGLLTAEKRKELLADLGERQKTRGYKSLQQLFEDQAARTPGHIALAGKKEGGGEIALTYRELNEKSTQMARYLRSKGVEPGTIVGVMKERSIGIVTGILGILKAGGAYMVIDPAMSPGGVNALLEENRVSLLLTGSYTVGNCDFTGLQGLVNGKARPYMTTPRPPIGNFDRLPIPDRSLVNYEKYSEKIGLAMVKHTISLQTTRGCPYHCVYCHKIWPKQHVIRPAESILEEITIYYKMGMRRFVFVDDIFNLDIPNSERFFKLLIEKGLRVHLFFPNGLRADLLTKDYIDLMVKAGTVSLGLALETASPRLQKLIKKNMNLEKLRENVEYISKKYPQVILELFLMHGFPTETEAEALMTLDFLKDLQWVDFPYFHILKIYPNSKMAELAVKNGMSPETIEKSASLAFHELPGTLPFDRNFTLRCQTEFLNDYFLLKDRLSAKLPYQMQVLTEDEMVQKYDSYLPVDITSFDDFLAFAGIERGQLKGQDFLREDSLFPPRLNEAIGNYFHGHEYESEKEDALRVILLDLSQFFSSDSKHMLYGGVEPPLGLMYLATHLKQQQGNNVKCRIAKSGIDFDNYNQLKALLDEFKPGVIGIRTLSYYKNFFHQTIAMIRGWGIDTMIIAGGPYASSDYKTLLQDRNVDLVVMGEGEITFLELIETIRANKGKLPGEEVLKEIKGIVFAPERDTSSNFAREIIMVDAAAAFLEQAPVESAKPPVRVNPGEPAYLYYTPGKKGKQEFAAVDHQGVRDLLQHLENSFYEQYEAGRRSEISLLASYLFDLSPGQIFTPLLKGGLLYILPDIVKTPTVHLLEVYKNAAGVKEYREIPIHIRLLVSSEAREVAEGYVPPGDSYEEQMVHIWAEVLGLEPGTIGIDDNFFELGGHSLKATTLISQIHKVFNVNLKLIEIFKTPTIQELAKIIQGETKEKFTAIEAAEKKKYYELSSPQKRLYIIRQMDETSLVYNMPAFYEVEGPLDKEKLAGVFRRLIQRHESLRTSFQLVGEGSMQIIHDEVEFGIEWYDPGTGGTTAGIIKNFVRPFDLSQAPLLRVGIVETREYRHILMVDMHHIIGDGTSTRILLEEFAAIYAGKGLPALVIQYKDYSEWRNSRKEKKSLEKQEAYWLSRFEGEIPVLDLPVDYPRPAVQRFDGAALVFETGTEETTALKTCAFDQGTTLYMVLLAAYNIFLAKLGSRDSIVVGAPVAGRKHSDLRHIIGMFINTLALTHNPLPGKTCRAFIEEVTHSSLEAFENQDYPYEELIDRLSGKITRDTGRSPLFDVTFLLQNVGVDMAAARVPGLVIKPMEHPTYTAKFDLSLVVIENRDKLLFTFEYGTRLFKEETIRRFAGYYKRILAQLPANISIKLSDIEIISREEKHRVLHEFNEPAAGYPGDKILHRLFTDQVEETPDNIAVVGPGPGARGRVTYKELNRRSDGLARLLREKGVKPDTIVGIMAARSMEMITGILGILKAGGAYLPIDPGCPEDRIKYMLADSGAGILLTAPDLASAPEPPPSTSASTCRVSPANLAYIIFTSGSTGKPKGVPITHANLSPLLHWGYDQLDLGPQDRTVQNLAYYFDWSVWEIFISLTSGGQLYMVPEEILLSSGDYIDFTDRDGITVLHMTPTQYSYLLQAGRRLETLSYLFIGAEKLSRDLLERSLASVKPGCRVFNMYGPTEAAIISAVMEIEDSCTGTFKDLSSVPIGRAVGNTRLFILDKHYKLCPVNIAGELYISGGGVAAGYLNNPGLTAGKFLYMSHMSHMSYIYRTGDLARWLPDGNIEFSGRIDHQVKIRGFRIELEEIEHQLLKHDLIKEAVVTAGEDETGDNYLCAYVMVKARQVLDRASFIPGELKKYLSTMLPDYMIPSYFVEMEQLPLNPNGKVDRKALPHPKLKVAEEYAAPRDKIEKKLAELWASVLGIEEKLIGIDANFFHLGGHSLKATLLVSRVRKELHVEIPLIEIFTAPSIRELAGYIKTALENNPRFTDVIEIVPEREYYEVSSAQKRLYIVQQMEPQSTAYNMLSTVILEGEPGKEKLQNTFHRLIHRHESLRTSFEMIDGLPVQKIHDEVEFEMEYYQVKVEVEEIISNFVCPFDLSRAPLLRVGLIKIRETEHILMIDMHHIVSDGLSMEIFVTDFISLYMGEKLPTLPIQYKDFAYWQNSRKLKNFMKKQEEYWLKQFRDMIPVLELPADFERPKEKTFEGRVINFEIGSEETRCLNDLARDEGATLFMVLAALFNVLLAKISGMEDIVVGTPVAGRRHTDIRQVIGMFVNTLPLRNYPAGEKTFRQFLGQVKAGTLEAFNNQDYQFEDLVEKLDARRDANRNPMFDVMFALQNKNILSGGVPRLDTTAAGLTFRPFQLDSKDSKFDLVFYAFEEADKISCMVEYSTDLFREETIRRINRYFLNILEEVSKNPGLRLAEIRIIGREETDHFIKQLREKRGMALGEKQPEPKENTPGDRPKVKQAEFDF